MITKAVVLVKKIKGHEAFELQDWTIGNCSKNEVLIECEAFGLNYADVMASQGLYKEAPARPCVIGYEVVGKIIKVGPEVAEEFIGKRVLAFTRFGGYAQHAITTTDAIVEVQDEPVAELLALATQGATALYMSNKLTTISKEDCVLIHRHSWRCWFTLGTDGQKTKAQKLFAMLVQMKRRNMLKCSAQTS